MQGSVSSDHLSVFKSRPRKSGKKRKRASRAELIQHSKGASSSDLLESQGVPEDDDDDTQRRQILLQAMSRSQQGLSRGGRDGALARPPKRRREDSKAQESKPDSGEVAAAGGSRQLGATFQQGAGLQGTEGRDGDDDLGTEERERRERFVAEKLQKLTQDAADGSFQKGSSPQIRLETGDAQLESRARGLQALRQLEQTGDQSLFAEPEAVRRARAAAREEQQRRRLPLGPDGAPYHHGGDSGQGKDEMGSEHATSSSSLAAARGGGSASGTKPSGGAAQADGDVGQGGMLAYNTGLAEVELPSDERLRVIAETEKALRAAQAKRARAEEEAAAIADREAAATGGLEARGGPGALIGGPAGAGADLVRFSGSSMAADFTKHRRAFSYKMRSKGAGARLFRRKEEAKRLRARGEHARADAMEKDAEQEAKRAMLAAQEQERKALHWEDEHHGGEAGGAPGVAGEGGAGQAGRTFASDDQLFSRIKGRTYMRKRG